MSAHTIVTENLTRDFATVRALDSLSIQVPSGIVFGFLGPNGAGKTTTIRLLLGLMEPTAGHALVLGLNTQTHADAIRAQTGVLFEYAGLYERLSAEDNLEFYGRIWHLAANERRARTRDLLTHFDLWERRKERVRNWSRGMRQKLAIARTLMHRPRLIFLDEPTAGLDPVAAVTVRDDLLRLAHSEGVTIFLTTHNLVEAQKLCAQVAVIRRGRLVTVGTPDALGSKRNSVSLEISGRGFNDNILGLLKSCPQVIAADVREGKLWLEVHPDADAAPLVTLLVQAGALIEEVHKTVANLEEVFMLLMQEPEC